MDSAVIDRFLDSLDRLEVAWARTRAGDLPGVLSKVVVGPAVGAPLPFENCTLQDIPIALEPTPGELEAAKTGVTAARLGIADYGTVVVQSGPDATEAASLLPGRHVAVLRASDVVPDMTAALDVLGPLLREEPTSVVLATGPSATADMGALVRGAHGPKDVHVVLLDDK